MRPCNHHYVEEYDGFEWCKQCGALAFYDTGPGDAHERYMNRWNRCIVPLNEGGCMVEHGRVPKCTDTRGETNDGS